MTPTEAARVDDHALRVAFEERHAELTRYVAWCEANRPSWTDLVREYQLRLDELDRLVAKVPSGCQSDYLGGPGCTCVAVAR